MALSSPHSQRVNLPIVSPEAIDTDMSSSVRRSVAARILGRRYQRNVLIQQERPHFLVPNELWKITGQSF
jgi:hypothetical protein